MAMYSFLWFFFIIILGTLISKTHNHFPIFKNMKIKSTKFMIIIIVYLSQAYDWQIDQMIMLEICHKSCYTTMEKNYKHHCIKNELNYKILGLACTS